MLDGPETPPKPTFKAVAPKAVWSPGQKETTQLLEMTEKSENTGNSKEDKENLSPIWQPFGPLDDKPSFRSVKLDNLQFNTLQTNTSTYSLSESTSSTSTGSTVQSQEKLFQENQEPKNAVSTATIQLQLPRKKHSTESLAQGSPTSTAKQNGSVGSPTSPPGNQYGLSSGLPVYQNPTITLLQKAREGQIPKGARYIENVPISKDHENKEPFVIGEMPSIDGDENYVVYAMPIREEGTKSITTIKAPQKYEGIGPIERGIPLSLRTGVKEEYASDWYKTMFKSLHKFDKNRPNDDLQTIRYTRKSRTPHSGGYMSEPEYEKDEDFYKNRYAARGHRQSSEIKYPRVSKQQKDPGWYNYYFDSYHNQPRSIADYEPGHSSIAEREKYRSLTRRYLPPLDQPKPKYIDGYESDSTLIRKTGSKINNLDPELQKAQYREVQKGGDIPFEGLGKPAPERPKFPQIGPASPLPYFSEADFLLTDLDNAVTPHRYQETEVNIHYKTPVRNLEKEFIDEEELGQRQEEAMRRFYEEERYKKQLQQLHELEMRRHNDNLLPSQKSPIPLNRYDNPFEPDHNTHNKPPSDIGMAKVLYNFSAQSSRELALKKNDIVKILRKVDKNWYEGELDGVGGIFPVTYVQLITKPVSTNTTPDSSKSIKDVLKPTGSDGEGKAKFNFKGQTPVELSLTKGETVILKRKVDNNWFEGQTTSGKGIFPSSYVQIISLPKEDKNYAKKNPKLRSHRYGNLDSNKEAFSSYPNTSQSTQSSRDSHSLSSIEERRQPLNQSLHIDTCNDIIPYRVLYAYKPQNDDELELTEGDTVYVLEKCDDGWFVGTSLATGLFGTFPGNYVERAP